MFPRTFPATIIKLNIHNYLLWTQQFHVFVGAQGKTGHILNGPPDTKNHYHPVNEYCVIIGLSNSMEESQFCCYVP